ncbi:MAG: cob(I)yrinic acid a,c-diamide adenosyltransferase [Clostridia bacterium]|nr:cob(I)yrinic acid a,c-diamide adenosyltransferase [Clostridia bacterium]
MGCVHVYTGDGKGKTTAALGLLMRAVGAGYRVCLFQFMKKGLYSEIRSLRERFAEVEIHQFGSGKFIDPQRIDEDDLVRAAAGFDGARAAIQCGAYDMVILDEANVALHIGLLSTDAMLSLLREKPERTEIVLTGRNAPEAIIKAADLCTEMRAIKHYLDCGVPARKGIEL